jgi:sigma-E factor negative regulatory protein RseA
MEHEMSSESAQAMVSRERLSALVDGELDGDEVGRACAHWRDDGAARSTWHAYHLIGDVLRSDDLAADASRDSAFLVALRGRLASEPVVLAPAPLAAPAAIAPRGQRRAWMAPVAAAAGFAAVAVVVVVMRGNDSGVAVVTALPAPKPDAAVVQPVAAAPVAAETPITGPVVRDARLDYYLSAHKQFSGSSALGAQGFLRAATAEGTGR